MANDLLYDAPRLDNELSTLAATCPAGSVSEVQINHSRHQNHLWNCKIPWRVSLYFNWKFYMISINVSFSSSQNLIRRHKIWYGESQRGPSHYFHVHVRAPPTAVPGCVDGRINLAGFGYGFIHNSSFDSHIEIYLIWLLIATCSCNCV